MKGTGKFLTAVFAVLFVVLLGELGYIYYTRSQSKNNPQQVPVPTLTIDQVDAIKEKPKNPSQAINQDMIEAMMVPKKGVVVSSKIDTVYQGTVTELNSDGDGMKVRIQGTNGESNAFFYSTAYLKKFTFSKFHQFTNETEKIGAADIQMGDLLRIEETNDMLQPLNSELIEGKITVITQ